MKFTLLSVIAAVVAIVTAVPLEISEHSRSCPSCEDYFIRCIRDNCGTDRRFGDNSCLEACRVGTDEWDYNCHICRLPGDPVVPSATQDVQIAPEVRHTVPGTQNDDYVDCVDCMNVANHCVASICGDNWSNIECKVACIKTARKGHGGLCHYCPMPESAISPFGRPPYRDAQPAINSREVVSVPDVGTPFCKSCTLHFQQCLRDSCDSSPFKAALCSEECIEEGDNHSIETCEKTCAKQVCEMDSICKSCDSFVDKC
ncbi:hypothetical protein K505DRAFT_362618 [Melanomma pulvis-pyrius CBS 109.77]|uniref:Uncharacterized protein n=1 Tax=Melanomma pulvis-pyrius CBS 109.77 TaxID=1314802 RepID=A0A6A6X9E8_9PLEO|nr:hypothetical protein K505DRAFT_362618 [Melanomma pulvis-pyrius CBS 109.77]